MSQKKSPGEPRGGRGEGHRDSLFGELPKSELAPFALDDDAEEIGTLRADVRGVGIRNVVRRRERASLSIIHEQVPQRELEREHARARPTALGADDDDGPPPDVIRRAEERRLRAGAVPRGQVEPSLHLRKTLRLRMHGSPRGG
jgi:hypothetical protein